MGLNAFIFIYGTARENTCSYILLLPYTVTKAHVVFADQRCARVTLVVISRGVYL